MINSSSRGLRIRSAILENEMDEVETDDFHGETAEERMIREDYEMNVLSKLRF